MLEESCRQAQMISTVSPFASVNWVRSFREADHYAKREAVWKRSIATHIDMAIEAKYFRSNLIQEKINDLIRRNTRS